MGAARLLAIWATVCALLILISGPATASLRGLNTIAPSNMQHVQFTVAIANTSCSMLPKDQEQSFADRFRAAVRKDVQNYLSGNDLTDAAASVKSVADVCFESTVSHC